MWTDNSTCQVRERVYRGKKRIIPSCKLKRVCWTEFLLVTGPNEKVRSHPRGAGRGRSHTPPPGGRGAGRGRGGDSRKNIYNNNNIGGRGRDRKSSEERNINTPWTNDNNATNATGNDTTNDNRIPTGLVNNVPSTWTTASGKFHPNESELGFDTSSNINGHRDALTSTTDGNKSNRSSRSNKSSRSTKTVTSMGVSDNFIADDDDDNNNNNDNNKSKKHMLLNGEPEDPVARQRFYKNLKKVGIKSLLVCILDNDDNDNDDDGKTTVSEMSFSEASYILDLAQQKESREKDRQEEALEEALELYRTWLMEGKNDDKNIFLMILSEVKKERKEEYEEYDKKHDSLLNVALDSELKRRESETKHNQQQQQENMKVKEDPPSTVDEPHKSTARIDKVIERNKSSTNLDDYNDDYPEEWNEPYDTTLEQIKKPKEKSKTKTAVSSSKENINSNTVTPKKKMNKKKKSLGIFDCFGSNIEDDVIVETQQQPPKNADVSSSRECAHKPIRSEIKEEVNQKEREQEQEQKQREHHEDTKSMFSRLRKQLSERKVQEKTEEDKWWQKINDAKTEEVWWQQQINDENRKKVTVPEIAEDTPSPSIILPPLSTSITNISTKEKDYLSESKREKKKSHKRRKSSKGGTTTTTTDSTSFLDNADTPGPLKSFTKRDDKEDNKGGNDKDALVVTKGEKKKKKKMGAEIGSTGSSQRDDEDPTTPNIERKISHFGIISTALVKSDNDNESNDTDEKIVSPKREKKSRKSKVEKKESKDDGNYHVEKIQSFKKKKSTSKDKDGSKNEGLKTSKPPRTQTHTRSLKRGPSSGGTTESLRAPVRRTRSEHSGNKKDRSSSSSNIERLSQSNNSNNYEHSPKRTKKKKGKVGSTRSLNKKGDKDTDETKSPIKPASTKKKKKIKSGNSDRSLLKDR
ncbi:hypothetical protein FRACYDRAFT_238149 [Fragilariopsis cylindrus CCMP1102]|uniref:Uncharacterized protein n=1 Tax=Fragilariopsis cylindrus CCMP1102 TaxID=635003 RepID=A0A1E7FHS3_9STRA|nr:hypothetical protein FRACYDRAFT_238149 [Fragilariopsis cylindrus CCMP1102]|eukprot:OEU17722.1 hypothetical protein FRACYDRAFT_238149 [Fragilariopsis cylindrus CCMP1102]